MCCRRRHQITRADASRGCGAASAARGDSPWEAGPAVANRRRCWITRTARTAQRSVLMSVAVRKGATFAARCADQWLRDGGYDRVARGQKCGKSHVFRIVLSFSRKGWTPTDAFECS